MVIRVLILTIGSVFGLFLVGAAIVALFLTYFFVFGWRGHRLGKLRQHLYSCVVEDDCPRNDEKLHRWIEKRVFTLDQRFGLIALIPAAFVWVWIDVLLSQVRSIKQNFQMS